jgi:hypothetical protein
MSTSRPFTYNTGAIIPGTEKFGNLTVGTPTSGFETTVLQWWNGPDEDLGYVIAETNVDINGNPQQPTPIFEQLGSVSFNRTNSRTYSEFVGVTNHITGQNFITPDQAKIWLQDNSGWTSWERTIPNDIENLTDSAVYDTGFVESKNTINGYINEIGTSLYDSASLFITANAVNEGKLFSLKPSDRSGDINVSRATAGTRVNSNGLVEDYPYNVFPLTENFSLSRFNYFANVSITTNIGESPIGTNTVSKYLPTTVNNYLAFSNTVRYFYTNSIINISVYAKIGECTTFDLGGFFNNESATFNLQTGVITPRSANVLSYSIENVGSGWYRCKVSYKFTNGIGNNFLYSGITRVVSAAYNGINGMFFWGFQVTETSDTRLYFPTINRTNLPRISYINNDPYILIEPLRTNLFSFSAGNLTTYGLSGGTVSTATSSINGFSNSIQFGDTFAYAYKTSFAPVVGTGYYLSVFVQMDDNSEPVGGVSTATGDFIFVFGGQLLAVSKVQRIGTTNVYRCSGYREATSTSASIGVIKYATQSTKPFRFSGIQLEVGTNETSYIPTYNGIASRNADVISKTGITNLIGQTEGTVFVEFNRTIVNAVAKTIVYIFSDATNRIRLYLEQSSIVCIPYTNNVFIGQIVANSIPLGNVKVAYSYSANGQLKLFVNGQLVGQLSLGALPVLNQMTFNESTNTQLNDGISKVILWKTQLTQQQCIDLTTL